MTIDQGCAPARDRCDGLKQTLISISGAWSSPIRGFSLVLEMPDRELVDRPGVLDIAGNMFREHYLREQAGSAQQVGPEPDFT